MEPALPFRPSGSTFVIAGTPTASPAFKADGQTSGDVTYIFDNSRNSVAAWIGYGSSSTIAQTNATIAAIGGLSQALPIAKSTVQAFTLSPNLFFSTIMEQGSGTVTCTVGYGT